MRKWLGIAALAALVLAGCSSGTADQEKGTGKNELKNVTMVLDWTPNTNHTGLYVAQEKGYFEEQGLDVEIVMPGEAGANQLVASNEAEFGISAQESLTEARVQGIPIVSVAAVIQHNTSGFASPAEKNIRSPKDYEGKTYGGWGAPVEEKVLSTLMEGDGADISKLEFLNMGNTDFFTAVERDVDFAWSYYGWDGIEAELREIDLNIQYLADFSDELDYYTPIIITSEKLISKDPDLVSAFVAAASKGYEYSIKHPGEAADILIGEVPELDEELVRASQEWLAPKYRDDADRWGEQKESVWAGYANWMHEHGLIEEKLDVEAAFTNDFLPKEEK